MNPSNPHNSNAQAAHTNGHLTSASPQTTESSRPVSNRESVVSEMDDVANGQRSRPSSSQSIARDPSEGLSTRESSDAMGRSGHTTSAAPESEVVSPAPCSFNMDGAGDERPTSSQSRRASKRKSITDEDDFIANNPELYGLRRSVSGMPLTLCAVADAHARHELAPLVEW